MARHETAHLVLLPPVRSAVAAARRHVERACRDWQLEGLEDNALLLTSELVTNAIVHGSGPVRLQMHRSADRLRIEVGDDDPTLPSAQVAGNGVESGRGLMIVTKLSADWGARPNGPGKIVWFELTTPVDGQRAPAG